jgi:NADH dehydrogenase
VRPSLLDGHDGFGARWLRVLARLPVHAFPADANGRIAAMHVEDLGEALANLALMPAPSPAASREYELGGDEASSLGEYLARLRGKPAWSFRVPSRLARVLAHVCDALHVSPFSYGHWELLRRDNSPTPNRLRELLGRAPRDVGRQPRKEAMLPSPLNATARNLAS